MLENYYIIMCADLTFKIGFHLPLSSVMMAIGNVILFTHDSENMIQNNFNPNSRLPSQIISIFFLKNSTLTFANVL